MKTNIKMRVTPEQSRKVQEICFENGFEWLFSCKIISHLLKPYLIIENYNITYRDYGREFEHDSNIEEIDANLFIRTNGTCEEDEFKNFIQSQDEVKDNINQCGNQFTEIDLKLKKKNEILKKARIKRKNQREELNKLNLKLQKCISLEELEYINHENKYNLQLKKERIESLEDCNERLIEQNKYVKDFLDNLIDIRNNQQKEIEKLKAENIEMGKLINLNKSELDLAVITKELAMNEIERKNKEIENLKAVIEYLESKVNEYR